MSSWLALLAATLVLSTPVVRAAAVTAAVGPLLSSIVERSFSVAAALTSQTITFNALSNKTFGNAPFTVSATASSGLAVSFSSLTTAVCMVSGKTVTLVAAGTCTLRAAQAGDANYAPAPDVDRTFTVAKASQTITFATLGNKTVGAPPFTISASASSGLPVSFASLTAPVCTVSGNTVTIVAAGTCTIQASQAGNANFNAAANVNRSFTVAKVSQTITFATLGNKTVGAPPFTVSATASSGLPVSFSSLTASVCTVSGNTVTIVAAGTCTIQASQAGNATYAAAPNVNRSFTVSKVSQTITFAALSGKTFGDAPFTVSATASSGLPVSFASLTGSVCTVNGNTVTIIAAGTCTIQAKQAGDATYAAAPNVNQGFAVAKASQTITFGALTDRTLGSAPFTVSATASSGLAVTFASLTTPVCTVSGSTVTMVALGTCTIQAKQAGNANYTAAPNVNQSFTVKTGQTIAFGALGNKILGAAPFTVSATASSGLPVSFSSLTISVCTVSGNTVTLVAAGTCTVRASQAGNANYGAAPNVDQSFSVTSGSQTITFNALANQTLGAPPFAVSATASSSLPVSLSSLTTSICTVSGNTVTLVAIGTCTIRASQAGNANYSAAPNVDQSFFVVSTPQGQVEYIYDAAGNLIQVTRSAVTPRPDLTVSNLSVGTISLNGNGSFSIPVTFQINNIGSAAAAATWYDRGYLAGTAVLHNSDQALGGFNTRTTNLAMTANYTVSTTFTTSTTTTAGNYYLIVKADGGASASGQYSPTGANYVAELDEANNTQVIAINLPANPKPDLTVSNASVGTISVSQNGSYSFPVTYTVTNSGNSSAAAWWYDMAYLSADGVLDNSDQNLSGIHYQGSALAAGASYTLTTTFTTTTATAAGSYTLFIKADGLGPSTGGTNTDNGRRAESNETNNTQSVALTLPTKPDLTVSNASVGTISVSQNGSYSFPVTYTVTNSGGSSAGSSDAGYWYDMAYLSADGVLDNGDQNLSGYHHQSTALAAGTSYTVTTTFTTTTATAAGSYTLFIKADGRGPTNTAGTNTDNGRVTESNETNNTQSVVLTLPTKPDLTVSNASVGTISVSQNGSYSFPVSYTVTNSGGSSAAASWYDLAYLSADGVLDNSDQNLSGTHYQGSALAAGASYTVTRTFTTTTTAAAGSYTLFVKADGHGAQVSGTNTDNGYLAESNETNNTQSVALTLPTKPDLTLSNASVGTITVRQNGSYSFPVTYTVTNSGGSSAAAGWYDQAYLSADGVLDNSDQNLSAYHYQSTALAAGASYTVTTTFTTTTATAAGSYTLFIKADGRGPTNIGGTNTDNGNVAEANETNNTASIAILLP